MHFATRSSGEDEHNELYLAWTGLPADTRASCIDLTVSNPTRAGFAYGQAELSAALNTAEATDYQASALGNPAARAAIADCTRDTLEAVDPARIILTASTSEAYAMLFKLLCDPGDEVVLPEPSYPLLAQLARLESVQLLSYRYDYDGAWYLDISALRARLRPRTRAIVVVSPNNPTGHRLTQADLDALLDLNLPIIVDAVFDAYSLRVGKRPATCQPTRGLVFFLYGLSKYALLPQLKLAWTRVSGDADLVTQALRRLEHMLDAYLSVAAPVQHAVGALLALAEPMRARVVARLQTNWQTLQAIPRESAVTVLHAEAGWTACLRLPALYTDMDWAMHLLHEVGTYVHPGEFYGLGPSPHVVVSLLVEESKFADGIHRIVTRVDTRAAQQRRTTRK
jgi:alanine-synthesizing transaminase